MYDFYSVDSIKTSASIMKKGPLLFLQEKIQKLCLDLELLHTLFIL